jgi:hypothetical protein
MRTGGEQRIDLPRPVVDSSEQGALSLADAYWEEIRRLTLGVVRARRGDEGIEITLAGTVSLLRFAQPQTTVDDDLVRCRFQITGGVLAKRSGGSLSIAQRARPSTELVVTVEDYAPRLDSGRQRGGLRTVAYRHLQQPVHVAIGRRYLERMAGRRR